MAFEHNDFATKSKLNNALGETEMGFERNDFVTVDQMNEAIAEGGGGLATASVAFTIDEGASATLTNFAVVLGTAPDRYLQCHEEMTLNETPGAPILFPLVDGSCTIGITPDENSSISVSGECIYYEDDAEIDITGDCAVAITAN